MPQDQSRAVVSVLLATYNGAAFLSEQLASIESQTYPAIDIWVSDDGSTDATLELLDSWRQKWAKGRFTVLPGPQKGYAENFRSLIVNPDIISAYYAFSDQDDLWEPEKIATSVGWIEHNSPAGPALFCSRTLAVTDEGSVIGPSPLFTRTPSFKNALAQSLAGGNTMLYNRAAHEILAEASRRSDFVSHDWWIYLIVSGAGGTVHYSPEMLVHYRQHVNNQIGSNLGMLARIRRLRLLFKGRFVEWTDLNMKGLSRNRDLLTREAREACDLFNGVRKASLFRRLYYLFRSGVYRQTMFGQLGLYMAALLRKI
ncbi:glycosyltransferase family 2 protein [Phyllobacterium sophorae]|uniref:Glycosyltransferase family 2 protein n=1 Tax=Phyllobacterium sophorae TaxID=1520277 RepID=A0A2P7AT64_9HYPH|nr:glycosyltransferase family 2 protein [Phyllobacterium sophorae]